MNKRLGIGAAAILAAVAGAYLASPLLAVRGFVAAAKSGDAARLERAVDFPAVRDALKPQLADAMAARARTDPRISGTALAGLGALLAPAIADRAVDRLVTPEGIATLVRLGDGDGGDAAPTAPASPARPAISYDYRYVGLDHFLVRVRRADRPGRPTGFTFERRGLFGWKLVAIDLPGNGPAPAAEQQG